MSQHSPSTHPPRPTRLAVVLIALDFLLFVPLGFVLVWLGIFAPTPSWGTLARGGVVALGVAVIALFLVVGVGAVRVHVQGRPRVRIEPGRLMLDQTSFAPREVAGVQEAQMYGVSFLLLDLAPASRSRVPFFDRIALGLAPPSPDGRRPLWITEQQLRVPIKVAIQTLDHSGFIR